MILNEMSRAGRLGIPPILDGILHIGHLRLEFRHEQFGRVQEGVAQIAGPQSGIDGAGFEFGLVGEYSCVFLPGGDQLSTRECGHVQDEGETVDMLGGMGDAVPQYQPSLRVGIVHLHGFARVHGQNVVVPECRGSDGVLGQTEEEVQSMLRTGSDGGVERPQESRRSSHVGLHTAHSRLGLEAQPSRIVHDALPDQRHRLGIIGRFTRFVRQNDEAGGTHRRPPHAVQSPISLFLQVIPHNFAKRHGRSQRFCHRLGLGGERLRGQFLGGSVD
mmetsp:Transcript_3945/g.10883  ORF Transcript_3945/g.10883 Transcript_3945/m.10883 type:complete len:274 (+) Transcript_3945:231-1052(+)